MANITQITKYAEILKSKLVTDFSLGTVIDWSAQGVGPNFFLRTRTADTIQTNFPVAGVDIITQNYKLTPAVDIFQLYFNSLSANYFNKAVVRFTTNTVQIWRNQEE
jgi:hypothetical protein